MSKNPVRMTIFSVASLAMATYSVYISKHAYSLAVAAQNISGDTLQADGADLTPAVDLIESTSNNALLPATMGMYFIWFILLGAAVAFALKLMMINKSDIVDKGEVKFTGIVIIASLVLPLIIGVILTDISFWGKVLELSWQYPLLAFLIYFLSLNKKIHARREIY